MLSHAIERGVLVVTVHDDPGIDGRADLVLDIEGLVRAYQPAPVVIVLEEPAAGPAGLSVVLRVHRACNALGVLLSAVSSSAPARRLLEANAETGTTRLIIHARADIAVATAALAAVA